MNKAQFEFMNQYEARKVFAKLFQQGIFQNGFKEASFGPTSGKVTGSKILLESTKYTSEELKQIVSKQKSL